MAHVVSEKPSTVEEVEAQRGVESSPIHDDSSLSKGEYNRAGAIDAENLEHNMGVLEAVKKYPAASFWAFVMSSTIVSRCLTVRWDFSDV